MGEVTRGERNALWIEEHCRVPEGRLVGRAIVLEPPQRAILDGIYNTPTRTAIASFPRKNGKTTLSACLVLLHLVGPEAQPNSQLYSTAQSRQQAAILFRLASKIVRMSPTLISYVTIRDSAKQLACVELGTEYTALSADAATAHGLSPILVIHDELGQVRGPRFPLYDAMETGSGAHDDPLTIIISTQAPEDGDLLSVIIDDAATGADPETKLFLWCAGDEDDPFIEATWRKANPLYGTALSPDRMKELAAKAKRMPSMEAAFRNLNLNQRVAADGNFVPKPIWLACKGAPSPEAFEAGPVFIGLDLSARNDITALAMVARDEGGVWHVRVEFFAPERGVRDRAARDRVPYDVWADEGLVTLTPGASVDYEIVAERLVEICDELPVAAIAFDRWRIDVMKKELERLDVELPLAPFGQGYKDMSPAIDTLEAALVSEALRHGGNPVLTWCASNLVATSDPAGNRKFDKKKATGRIDGMIAVTMGIGIAQTQPKKKPKQPSLYEQGTI